jgi:hypothetical protein
MCFALEHGNKLPIEKRKEEGFEGTGIRKCDEKEPSSRKRLSWSCGSGRDIWPFRGSFSDEKGQEVTALTTQFVHARRAESGWRAKSACDFRFLFSL